VVLFSINQHTISKVPSFTNSKDMIRTQTVSNIGDVTLITPVRGWFVISLDVAYLYTKSSDSIASSAVPKT